ncbi:MAG: arginine--tRNA ligase [Ilumatobacteraceae bacterium]
MADPLHLVADAVRAALADITGVSAIDIDPAVRPSDRADAQVNGALALAKQVGRSPRDLAAALVDSGALDASCAVTEIAGPGFVNLTFRDEFLADELVRASNDERLGVRTATNTETAVVDYSAPNVAKEMHVGHLRSTVIGDSIVRLLEFVGHRVVRENHIGDWGTPFGMLIEHLVDEAGIDGAADLDVADLGAFYRAAREKFDASDEFKERARRRVVLLQGRDDPETTLLWQVLVAQSVRHFDHVYRTLGVLLTDDDVAGESQYQSAMPEVLGRLDAAGLLDESDGAKVVWVPGYTNRDGEPLPLIVQARTGGFNYATSDLACVIDRVERIGATLLVYVVGTPQSQHLDMVFKVAEMAGWLRPPARAVHVNFGSVLGPDRKMLKSRSGDPVKFVELIDEAVERGRAVVAGRSGELPADEQAVLAVSIGVGALKYAELSSDRIKDYIFDWDRMLALDGNTAPYLQYAHARVCSIFRRASAEFSIERAQCRSVRPELTAPEERALSLHLLQFDSAVHDAVERFSPHRLCTYLFELAHLFTSFYEACPVLRAEPAVRASRLAMCDLTARVLGTGLDLLGIAAPERM